MSSLRRKQPVVKCLLLLLCIISAASARSLSADDPASGAEFLGSPVLLGSLACVAGLVCMIVLLFGCSEICDREVAFKDFENDDVFSTEVEEPPALAPSQFTMYPPMESTPDAVGPIVFDPLPEPIHLKRSYPEATNVKLLRPKVALSTLDRRESEDSLDEDADVASAHDEVAQKVKLHNLLARTRKVNSRNQVPRSQLQYIKELGNGWFGKVLQGEGQKILPGHKKTKVVIQMLKEDADSADQLAFLQEGLPYRDVLDTPNVLRLLGQCVDTVPYLTILELCPFGDVKTYLRSHRIAVESFNEKGLLLKFACDMAAGLQALNQHGYCHRDFAARNCLLSSDLTVKVGDYGLSEETFKEDYYVDSEGSSIPIRWLAPETMHVHADGGVNLRKVTKESNVWSFGVTLWEIITFGSLPYSDLSNEHVLRLVVRERSLKPNKPDMPVSHLHRLYELMQLCWSDVPARRPSLRELRIMMLHLMSSKLTTDTTVFDKKWNQLMPRKPPQIAKVSPQPQFQILPTIDAVMEDRVKASQQLQRPLDLGNGFAQLNPSQLGNASGLDCADLTQVHGRQATTTPINDRSLDAEFSAMNMRMEDTVVEVKKAAGEEAGDSMSPANELSLAAELSQAPADSDTEDDDVIEIHAPEEMEEETDHENRAFEQDENSLSPVKSANDSIQVVVHSPSEATEDMKASMSITPDHDSFGEFFTSTPRRSKSNTSNQSTRGTAEATSSSFYQTALGSQTSTDDEPSILGQRKFAACLQTVVTSFDGEELDPLSLSCGGGCSIGSGSSLEEHRSIPEVLSDPEEDLADGLSHGSLLSEKSVTYIAVADNVFDVVAAGEVTATGTAATKTDNDDDDVMDNKVAVKEAAAVENSASPLLDLSGAGAGDDKVETGGNEKDGLTA